jgi:hypothetical protein
MAFNTPFCDAKENEYCESMFVDDSFDHAFGTEIIQWWCCANCGQRLESPDPTDYGD